MKNSTFKSLTFFCMSVLTASVLSACTGMNTQFGCHAVAGDSCTPVSQVNQRAQAGVYDHRNNATNRAIVSHSRMGGYDVLAPKPGEPIRFSETIQRIWIAPFQDASGNYHEPSFIYTVLKRAHWIDLAAHAITLQPEED